MVEGELAARAALVSGAEEWEDSYVEDRRDKVGDTHQVEVQQLHEDRRLELRHALEESQSEPGTTIEGYGWICAALILAICTLLYAALSGCQVPLR